MKPIVYTSTWCSDCQALKNHLQNQSIEVEYRDVQMVPSNLTALRAATGHDAVPFIHYNGQWLKAYGPGFSWQQLNTWLGLFSIPSAPLILTQATKLSHNLLKECGKYALEKQHRLSQIEFKASKDLVTEVDHELDNRIRTAISASFPDHNLMTEESPDFNQGSDWTWVVDPIDGTVNYSRGLPLFGISIALLFKNQPVLGSMFLPAQDELYTAQIGKGAFCNGQSISVSTKTSCAESIISNGDFNVGPERGIPQLNQTVLEQFYRLVPSFQRVKSFGSAIWESAQVASGRLDAYSMAISHPWDIAAGSLIVEEAGGQVSHQNGDSLLLKDLCTVLFSNGFIHPETLAILNN